MREAKNPNAKAPTKPRRLRRQADNYDACDGKSEAECNNEAMDGLECSAEDMLGNQNVGFGIGSENFGSVIGIWDFFWKSLDPGLGFICTNSGILDPGFSDFRPSDIQSLDAVLLPSLGNDQTVSLVAYFLNLIFL